jgi:hypothetical protein
MKLLNFELTSNSIRSPCDFAILNQIEQIIELNQKNIALKKLSSEIVKFVFVWMTMSDNSELFENLL